MVDVYRKLVGKYTNHPMGIPNVRWTGMTSPISIGGPDQVVPEPSEEAENGVPWGKSELDMTMLGEWREWQEWGLGVFFVGGSMSLLEGNLKEVDVYVFGGCAIWRREDLRG